MNSQIKPTLITALLSQYVSYKSEDIPEWRPNTQFLFGSKARANDNIYACLAQGITGIRAPSHGGGKGTDGTTEWLYIGQAAASDSLGAAPYLGLGGPGAWVNESTGDAVEGWKENDIVSGIKCLLRLNASNMSLGVKRIDWVSGNVYPAWPAIDSYVCVNNSVYRCLDNNLGAASTVAPHGTTILPAEESDGYVWKYLGDISPEQNTLFGQATVFPISELFRDDGSARWLVQQSAANGSISGYTPLKQFGTFTTPNMVSIGAGTGAAARIELTQTGTIRRVVAGAGGSGYSSDYRMIVKESAAAGSGGSVSVTISGGQVTAPTIANAGSGYSGGAIAIVEGDGNGATITLTVTGGYITAVSATGGTGYTWAKVHVIPGNSGALVAPVMSPVGGHGKNMVKELPVNKLLISRRLTSLDKKYIPTTAIRQISLVSGIPGGALRYLGPAGVVNAGQEIAQIAGARVLYVNNIPAMLHSEAQDELLKIALSVE